MTLGTLNGKIVPCTRSFMTDLGFMELSIDGTGMDGSELEHLFIFYHLKRDRSIPAHQLVWLD
jgi:hypothetical protein